MGNTDQITIVSFNLNLEEEVLLSIFIEINAIGFYFQLVELSLRLVVMWVPFTVNLH